METGLLHLHNILRWLILLFLLITLFQAFGKKPGVAKTSLWLLIVTHINFLIGLYQVIAGRFGILKGRSGDTSLMQDTFYRFYWIEHPVSMIIAVTLITVARRKAKALNYKATGWLLLIALLFIIAAVPWPFRDVVGRGLFPGMQP
jgi:glucan phosphoethanolaminetransferase (alkaline phosphatase superfamily)